jgi:transposase InsO family protein
MPEYLRSDNGSEFMNTLNEYLYWYNGKRIKISLGAKSPLEYRRMDPAAQQSK